MGLFLRKLWNLVRDHRLLIACVVLAYNIVITSEFVVRMNLILRLQRDRRITLPIAANPHSHDDPENTFTITMVDDNHMEAEGRPIDETKLRTMIGNFHGARISIRASRAVHYPALKKLMLFLNSAGEKSVKFSVVDPLPAPVPRESPEEKAVQR